MKKKWRYCGVLVLGFILFCISVTPAYIEEWGEHQIIKNVSPVYVDEKGFYVDLDEAKMQYYSNMNLWMLATYSETDWVVPVTSSHVFVPMKGSVNPFDKIDIFVDVGTSPLGGVTVDVDSHYNILNHTAVYESSKYITVKLARPLKGAVLRVRIGKKLYRQKLTSKKKKTIKIKIGRPTYKSKIDIKLWYKGRLYGIDDCDDEDNDRVWYAKQVRNGMTKDQVKKTWGGQNSTLNTAGWTYWYYNDGSYIVFQNGRVRRWYDAG